MPHSKLCFKLVLAEQRLQALLKVNYQKSFSSICAHSKFMLKLWFLYIFLQQQLIQLGAKKIAFVGVPPIGCVPSQRTLAGGILRDCAPGHNTIARLYNSRMAEEIEKIRKRHQTVTLIFADIYDFLYDMIAHPTKYGKLIALKKI